MTRNDLKMFAAAALTGLSLTAAGALTLSTADTSTPNPRATIGPSNGDNVKVYGCTAEDDCVIDYRGDRNGRGVWVITRRAH